MKAPLEAALEASSSLAREEPTPAYFAAFHEEIKREKNDRGAAILLACHVELCLRYMIRRNINKIEDAHDLLLSRNPYLHGFEGKIKFGYKRKLFGKETKNNLEYIKAIRNAFAHAVIPITFETPEVVEVCKFMKMPDILPPRAIDPKTYEPRGILGEFPTPREIFQKVCEATSHNLFVVSSLKHRPLP